jgi:hypothetical protein
MRLTPITFIVLSGLAFVTSAPVDGTPGHGNSPPSQGSPASTHAGSTAAQGATVVGIPTEQIPPAVVEHTIGMFNNVHVASLSKNRLDAELDKSPASIARVAKHKEVNKASNERIKQEAQNALEEAKKAVTVTDTGSPTHHSKQHKLWSKDSLDKYTLAQANDDPINNYAGSTMSQAVADKHQEFSH